MGFREIVSVVEFKHVAPFCLSAVRFYKASRESDARPSFDLTPSQKMDFIAMEEEEFGFSRNYFLAKEMGSSGKKSACKLSDINVIDEQELREASANIEPKH
ncbi:hypothetical protein GOBAR_DD10140 [Gossypium barbadense]|nr:hypothetical protein GOBAR_DD10140 [Gossypium barbadense]